MPLYTRQGDDGSTGLFGGDRTGKDHPRVVAYGTVDEANSAIGLAAAACDDPRMSALLHEAQCRLFDIGANLCTPDEADREKIPRITAEQVKQLERAIDECAEAAPAMRSFVLPGGTDLAARLHGARTVCRRAERCIVALGRTENIDEVLVRYVNRLSDLLFAMARKANHDAGVQDVPWQPRQDEPRE